MKKNDRYKYYINYREDLMKTSAKADGVLDIIKAIYFVYVLDFAPIVASVGLLCLFSVLLSSNYVNLISVEELDKQFEEERELDGKTDKDWICNGVISIGNLVSNILFIVALIWLLV